jgi:hypothetical protein
MRDPRIERVLNDMSASWWLKNALLAAEKRDPVDAANDAAYLAELLGDVADDIVGRG